MTSANCRETCSAFLALRSEWPSWAASIQMQSRSKFGGAGGIEVTANDDGDTFRAVYTVRRAGRVYVLDVFQKKSKSGIATPKPDLDRIKIRLKHAELDHKSWLEERKREQQS
jgi:Phage derived protein Gp49-like (DUF891)